MVSSRDSRDVTICKLGFSVPREEPAGNSAESSKHIGPFSIGSATYMTFKTTGSLSRDSRASVALHSRPRASPIPAVCCVC